MRSALRLLPLVLAVALATLSGPARAQQDETLILTQAAATGTPVLLGTPLSGLPGDNEALVQEVADEFLASPFDLSGLGLTGLTNGALLLQIGVGNAATVQQQGQGNAALVVEVGGGNTVSLSQIGDGNVYGAVLLGDRNQTTVVQDGDGNHYGLYFEGSDLSHSVVQQGDGNEAFQTGTVDSQLADVVQIGDGLQLFIEHN